MKADALKGMAIVSVESGAKLGYIDDVLFDTDRLCLAALSMKSNGGGGVLVPINDVRSIGNDAVTIQNEAVLRSSSAASSLASLPGLDRMGKLKVLNEAGNYLGKLSTLEIAPEDGKITQIQAHDGGVLGIGGKTITINAGEVRSVGDEVMVVNASPVGG